MKKLFKTLAVLAAVAALGFGFVSCGDPEDDNNGNPGSGSIPTEGIAASFKNMAYSYSSDEDAKERAEKIDENVVSTWQEGFIYFYENGTYIVFKHYCQYKNKNGKVEKDLDETRVEEKGTYKLTGTFDSGSIEFTQTHYLYGDKWYAVSTPYSETETIENGKFYFGHDSYEKQ